MMKAWAHNPDAAAEAFGWSFEPLVVVPLAVVALAYFIGSRQLRRRGKAERGSERLCFWIGFASLALALCSPLHALGTRVFAAHMVEHEIVMVVSAPLLVLSRPGAALLWGLPPSLRARLASVPRWSLVKRAWGGLTELWSATFIHALVLWVWHVPALFRPVLASEWVHTLQHASFLASAVLLWTAVFRSERTDVGQGAAVAALFLTTLQAGLLGALLTLSRVLWYPFAPDPFPVCGLTRLEDQALAGLIMWVPACMAYAFAALVIMARWLSALDARHA
jgi:putative membrane protein